MIIITFIYHGEKFDENTLTIQRYRGVETRQAERVRIEGNYMKMYGAIQYNGIDNEEVDLAHYDAVYIDGVKVYPE